MEAQEPDERDEARSVIVWMRVLGYVVTSLNYAPARSFNSFNCFIPSGEHNNAPYICTMKFTNITGREVNLPARDSMILIQKNMNINAHGHVKEEFEVAIGNWKKFFIDIQNDERIYSWRFNTMMDRVLDRSQQGITNPKECDNGQSEQSIQDERKDK